MSLYEWCDTSTYSDEKRTEPCILSMCQYFRLKLKKKIMGRYVAVSGRFMKVLRKHKLWKQVSTKNLFLNLTCNIELCNIQATALNLGKRQAEQTLNSQGKVRQTINTPSFYAAHLAVIFKNYFISHRIWHSEIKS